MNGARDRRASEAAAVPPERPGHVDERALVRFAGVRPKSRAERFAAAHAAVLDEHAGTFAKLAK